MLRRSLNISMMQRPPKEFRTSLDSMDLGASFAQSGSRSVLDNQNNSSPGQERSAYKELRSKIANSHMTVRKIKNGQMIQEGHFNGAVSNIPFLSHQWLQDDLKKYLKSGEMYIPKSHIPPGQSRKDKESEHMMTPFN